MNSWEEMSRKEQLEFIFWDAYKDAHGVRPRHIAVSAMSESWLEAEIDALARIIDRQEVERIEAQKQAIVQFESRVADTIAAGAGDRETAIRWIHEAEGSDGDDPYLCYLLNLPYSYCLVRGIDKLTV